MPTERWRRIPGAETHEVSSSGRVRNWLTGKHLSLGRHKDGYAKARIGGRDFLVRRLVLEAFVGPCPIGLECRHLNGDPADNRLHNLTWGTRNQNAQDMHRHGTATTGSKNGNSRLLEWQVHEIRARYATGWHTQRGLARAFGVSQRTIWNIVNEEQWCRA
jgi:hypothetical protein